MCGRASNVLSEIPGAWKAAVTKWRAVNRRHKVNVNGAPAPDPNEEYFLYQTLVGAWPFDTGDDEELARVPGRIAGYMTKAMREAKTHTSWLNPNEEYETAVRHFVEAILDRRRSQFLQSFLPFQARVAELGIYNSLSQLVIKMTAPGVPDFYQGTELWDLQLVDPDNRRPVDYDRRRKILAALNSCASPGGDCADQLLAHRADGRVKLFVTTRGLAARGEWRDLYEHGDYVPLRTAGPRRECLFAFARAMRKTGIRRIMRSPSRACHGWSRRWSRTQRNRSDARYGPIRASNCRRTWRRARDSATCSPMRSSSPCPSRAS